jgi:hypothetical protein
VDYIDDPDDWDNELAEWVYLDWGVCLGTYDVT